MKTRKARALLAAGAVVVSGLAAMSMPASAGEYDGLRTCAQIAAEEGISLTQLKLDRAPNVGDVVSDSNVSVEITDVKTNPDGEAIGFKGLATGDTVQYVIVKAATYTKVYKVSDTDPQIINDNGDFLYTMGQKTTGKKHHQEISYISFCY